MVRLVKESMVLSSETINRSSETITTGSIKKRDSVNSAIQKLSLDIPPSPPIVFNKNEYFKSFQSIEKTNYFKIMLTKGTSGLTSPIDVKYKICDENGSMMFSVREINPDISSALKILAVEDNDGEILRISYRLGLQTISLFEPNGELLGDCYSKLTPSCIPIVCPKGKYKFRTNGKTTLEVEGYLSFFRGKSYSNKIKTMPIKTREPSSKIGKICISESHYDKFFCEVHFEHRRSTFDERKQIIGMCIGYLDYSYHKHLASEL